MSNICSKDDDFMQQLVALQKKLLKDMYKSKNLVIKKIYLKYNNKEFQSKVFIP